MHTSNLAFNNVRLIDPFSGRDEMGNLFISDGKITSNKPDDCLSIDLTGYVVCPGLIDMHVHLREPGQTHKETIQTGTLSAASGGFTCVAAMPNTKPALDESYVIKKVIESSLEHDQCSVLPIGCITKDRAGKSLTDFASLKESGVIAFSDDGDGVEDDNVMEHAFELAASLKIPLIQHCEYKSLSDGGVMHLGEVSRQVNMPGLDPISEEKMIERDIILSQKTGGHYHVAHISTARAVELVREAKKKGIPVTTEVCTHHITLTDEMCIDLDPNTKMHPPLRTQEDVDACIEGLIDGTIDAIVTDHAPHSSEEKNAGFLQAPPGIIGLETAFSLAKKVLIDSGKMSIPDVIRCFTQKPADILKIKRASLEPGSPADISIIDLETSWTFKKENIRSKSHNTPFIDWEFTGGPVATLRANKLIIEGHVVSFQKNSFSELLHV